MESTCQSVDEIEIAQIIRNFHGNATELCNAIGAYVLGQRFGWKPLYLMFDHRSLDRYQTILGFGIRDKVPAVGPCADKSVAWKNMDGVRNYWKAVKGEIPGMRSSVVARRRRVLRVAPRSTDRAAG